MIEAKLSFELPEHLLYRRRVDRWLTNLIESGHCILMCGCSGHGKTTEICQWLKNNAKERYGYYRIDSYDNDPQQFLSYLQAAIHQSKIDADLQWDPGVCAQDKADSLLYSYVSELISSREKNDRSKGRHYLILDGLEQISNHEILSALSFIITYMHPDDRLILLSDGSLQEEITSQMVAQNLISVPMRDLSFSLSEMQNFAEKINMEVKRASLQGLYKASNGWPGLVYVIFLYLQHRGNSLNSVVSYQNPAFDFFMENNIWDKCSEEEKQILTYAAYFPSINRTFMKTLFGIDLRENTLVWLDLLGLLEYNMHSDHYTAPDMIKKYIKANHPMVLPGSWEERCEQISKASEWYSDHHGLGSAMRCLLYINDPDQIEDFLVKWVKEVWSADYSDQVKECIRRLSGRAYKPEVQFLVGVQAIYNNDLFLLEKTVEKLEENQESSELLLNLQYLDGRIELSDWLEYAAQRLKGQQKIDLFTITDQVANPFYSIRDPAALFFCTLKERNYYRDLWRKTVCEPYWYCFELAYMNYCLLTDQSKEVVEKLPSIYNQMGQYSCLMAQTMLFDLYCRLYRIEQQDLFPVEELPDLTQMSPRLNDGMLSGMLITRMYTEAFNGPQRELSLWLDDLQWNMEKTPYMYLMSGECYFLLGEYTRALECFRVASSMYASVNNSCASAESLFGVAVCQYTIGDTNEAVLTAIQAFTIGGKYHYINIFTKFGQPALELLQEYHKFLEKENPKRLTARKKYYYGTIYRASFEEYQDILLRCARRASRQQSGRWQRPSELLTATEHLVLDYIRQGYSNGEIADQMNIQLATVKSHVYSIFRKLDVKSRMAAVRKAEETHLL